MIEQYLIGTYTKSTSEGIYQLDLDTENGQLQNLQFVAPAGNPTYLAESDAKYLYAIDKETDPQTNQTKGGILVFNLNHSHFPLDHQQKLLDAPTSPAYLAIDEDRQLLLAANYHAGTVTTYKINSDGNVKLVDQITDTGELGPRPEQQNGPHPHYMDLTPDNRIVTVDLGLDKVYLYSVSSNGNLTLDSELQMPSGYGPRHIVFDKQRSIAYLVGELSSQLAVLDYQDTLSVKQIISTIPEDFTAHNGAAAIRMSSDGRYVYVSNRGYNSIAVFAVDDQNQIKLIQQISTEGDFPRDFNFSHDESYIICVNQNSDNATLYKRNAQDGKLKLIQKDFIVPEGVSVYPKK